MDKKFAIEVIHVAYMLYSMNEFDIPLKDLDTKFNENNVIPIAYTDLWDELDEWDYDPEEWFEIQVYYDIDKEAFLYENGTFIFHEEKVSIIRLAEKYIKNPCFNIFSFDGCYSDWIVFADAYCREHYKEKKDDKRKDH